MSSTVAFGTLGCRANQLESSALAETFRLHGWKVVPFSTAAALYVINTCTVTEDSDRESRRMIRRAHRKNPRARIAVTGCYVQIAPDQVAGIPGVNYVIGNNFKQDIFQIVQETAVAHDSPPHVMVSEIDKSRVLAGGSEAGVDRTRASLKIQDGCDFQCTYCIIWQARGASRSIPVSHLKMQLQALIDRGHHEVVLTGINIGQYCCPETGCDLAGLLTKLCDLPGTFRLRLSSLDPAEVTGELLAVMQDYEDRLCPYLHLSMQSAEDHVLKRMARRHRVADLERVCADIQTTMPGAAIGADIITGFPGETLPRFEHTYQVLSALPISYLHTFTYSRRTGTPAADFPDQVADADKKARTHRLMALSADKHLAYRQRLVGKRVQVVVEAGQDRGMSEQLVMVTLNQQDWPPNSLVPVQITEVTPTQTFGSILIYRDSKPGFEAPSSGRSA